MAFSGMGSSGGRMGRGRWSSAPLAEMNVVPLVDVVLVLLIIFMVTASVMEFGLNVDVPQVKQVRDTAEEHPVVTMTRDGTTYLNDTKVNINLIGKEVRRRFKDQDTVYVKGDKELTWGDFAQVISALDEAKLKQKVVTKPENRTK
ncbi:MAG: biopolymer transporter ExbD [Acidobacteriia bacterium]|jgi:biopolymer transport protein ExbD|nr:biopolymer transporter ExbD [Terriglobia bacterium]